MWELMISLMLIRIHLPPFLCVSFHEMQKRETACTVPLFWWIRLLCGAGPVAALTCHWHVIHYRSPSNPLLFPQ